MEQITEQLREFANERDWNQFHSAKNLILALVGEVGELASEVQWLTPQEMDSRAGDKAIADEIASNFVGFRHKGIYDVEFRQHIECWSVYFRASPLSRIPPN